MENLRVSTITSVAELNTQIDLDILYNEITIDDQIKYIEKGDLPPRGESTKKKRKSRTPKKRCVFFNQATIHFQHEKVVNVKLFNNGKIQMTGLKRESQGEEVIRGIIDKIVCIDEKNEKKIFITEHAKYEYDNYRVVLINSDFDSKTMINRGVLHETMVNMNMFSSFEPCIYPGVNIKYFYNESRPECRGVCECERRCSGKGDGKEFCKRVTIAVFNSGKIIITGAMAREQLVECYEFITDVIKTNPQVSTPIV
jgi:TATA-box binding protein (TBP) (component of TFIID and TFIIIB)|tara:strand:+ start:8978 stop:9742 length:765 start_codon:yes stop_codon:yes gene_type:complete